jgi:RHS repeat-associated protein
VSGKGSGKHGNVRRAWHRWTILAGLTSCLALFAAVLALGAGNSGAAHQSNRAMPQRTTRSKTLRNSRLRARTKRAARARATEHVHWLQSQGAAAQRATSQLAFHGLNTTASKRLLLKDFGTVLSGASANPAASIRRKGRPVRYLDAYRALVRGRRGLTLETSTTPLRVSTPDGGQQPVDLRLLAHEDAFAPAAPLTDVSIARDLGGGVAVGSSGLRITPNADHVPGSDAAGQSVFFANAGPDMDAAIAPKLHGAELFAVLRSKLSPSQLRYHVTLPAGSTLRSLDGGAVVTRGDTTLARIPSPSARDAQGSIVPVQMQIADDELVLDVADSGRQVAYPVLVDPEVVLLTETGAGWTFSTFPVSRDCGAEPTQVSGSLAPLTISTPVLSYPIAPKPPCFEETRHYLLTQGFWNWQSASPMHKFLAEFDGISLSATSTSAEGVYWAIRALLGGCGTEWSGYSTEPTTPTKILRGECGATEEGIGHVGVELAAGEVSEPGSVGAGGTLTVGAILLSSPWPIPPGHETEEYGPETPQSPNRPKCMLGHPVNCDTGNQVEVETDLSVGGRGPGLNVIRTYNSQLAANQSEPGPFGYGWTGSYNASLTRESSCPTEVSCTEVATVHQDNGGTVPFEFTGVSWTPSTPLVQATLEQEGSTFVYTLPDGHKLTFDSSGRLEEEVDRNGNAVTLTRNEAGQISAISDSSGREITYSYNGEGLVKSATDPMGHTVKYSYEGGNLTSVTEPGAATPTWRFEYDPSNQLTAQTDGLGHTVASEYDAEHRVISQTDAMGRTRKWSYSSVGPEGTTTVTEPNGSITQEEFNNQGLPLSTTRAGATTTCEYDVHENLIAVRDANGHVTRYGYDEAGDRTSETGALGHVRKWTFDSAHDVISTTSPNGETTTVERDAHGDAQTVSRPAPGEATQTTKYKYAANGDLESNTDPLGHVWSYEYDGYGDRQREVDPEGDVRTWTYDEDSRESSTVSPRGNLEGAEAGRFTTATIRDAQGRPIAVTAPEPIGGSSESSANAPTNSTAPTISGTAQDGQALEATAGSWEGTAPLAYAYRWQSCDVLGMSCLDLAGATHDEYTPGPGDVGTSLHVVVTAINSAGSASSSSPVTAPVVAAGAPWSAEYVGSYGTYGSGEGNLAFPLDVAPRPSGGALVLDTGNSRVEEFDGEGNYVSQFGTEGSGAGQMSSPSAIATDPSGNIWIADSANARIEEFSAEGVYLKAFGTEGSAPGQLRWPEGVTVDTHGDVWVSDTGNSRVEEFSGEGEYVGGFGSEGSAHGQFSGPKGLVVDASDHVWVADTFNNRLQELNSEGGFIASVGAHESGSELAGPDDLALDGHGHIWVSNNWSGEVRELGEGGNLLSQFGRPGSEAGQFEGVNGLAVDSSGQIWVADTYNDRVQLWSSAIAPANTSLPNISGAAVSGETLSARPGAWDGTPPLSYAYQWESCDEAGGECHEIPGANASTYTLGGSDVGTTVKVMLTASNESGAASATSALSAAVVAVATPTNTASPSISGTVAVGESLKADPGSWSGAPPASYGYQWRRCDSLGESCSDIAGATSPVYVVGHSDIAATLRVRVTASNSGGASSGTSPATEAVAPLVHTSRYTYDAAGNIRTSTDPDGHATSFTYDADNEPIKTQQTDGATTREQFDAAGAVISQTDGDGHVTRYARNEREQVIEVTDPLGRRTTSEYDPAGNLTTTIDAKERTTTYSYDQEDRVKLVTYSDGTTSAVAYEYDADGNRVKMADGTGETTDAYDQLDRLTESKDGNGSTVAYGYDLADEQTELVYPGAKTVERTYDKDDRLQTVTDWLGHTTEFGYDADSDPTSTKFPSATGEEDLYGYDDSGHVAEVQMNRGAETLASLTYSREKTGQLSDTSQTGLPGPEETPSAYDANGRLSKVGSIAYKYDDAGDPVKTGSSTNVYDHAAELESGTNVGYSYDSVGERIESAPAGQQPTKYGYDQAGRLTSVERAGEGETPAINDSYAYDGTGLRMSQTISGGTTQLTWDTSEEVPLILDDGGHHYVYGLGGLPLEQISNSTGAVTYLHHDQQGSTRLLTGSTGTVTGKCTYSAYGTPTCEGTTTTPLGYDAQYTSTDTGLIYMRARVYDPATAQFLTVDPEVGTTRAPYNYAGDNPLDEADPSGRSVLGEIGNFLEPLNPIKYYEEEIESYEDGCGYFASVAHGLEGAVIGALDASGAGEEGAAAEGAEEGLAATAHGAEQLAERGFSGSDIALTKSGEVLTQSDGATVYVKEVASGRFNVIVEGQRGVVTALKNIPQGAVNRLAQNYGWH